MRLDTPLLLALTVAGLMAGTETETFRWASPVAPGSSIEIRGVYGNVRARAAPGNRAEVEAKKHGLFDDASGVEVRVLAHARGYTICAVYPGLPDDCLPGGQAPAAGNNDVRVDFDVQVPRGVRLLARTVNGEVEARELSSDIEAYTVNGGVKISTSGSARAKTVNGQIVAEVREESELSTVNGEINVVLPANASAEVSARTSNGRFSTDFPIAGAEPGTERPNVPLTGAEVRGRIGYGGSRLRMLTVNGSIYLKKAPPGAPLSHSGATWE